MPCLNLSSSFPCWLSMSSMYKILLLEKKLYQYIYGTQDFLLHMKKYLLNPLEVWTPRHLPLSQQQEVARPQRTVNNMLFFYGKVSLQNTIFFFFLQNHYCKLFCFFFSSFLLFCNTYKRFESQRFGFVLFFSCHVMSLNYHFFYSGNYLFRQT